MIARYKDPGSTAMLRRRIFLQSLLLVAANITPLPAQPPAPLTLDAILDRLQANLIDYHHSVPDLYCNEHVESLMRGRTTSLKTTTDSLFRLRRTPQPDHTVLLEESREVQKVDGHRPLGTPDHLNGPAILYGVFSYGLDIVSNDFRACIAFKLHPIRPDHPAAPILIDFKSSRETGSNPHCSGLEETYGRASIDPQSMHILRIEKITPHHKLFPNNTGLWTWTIDYAPVQLLGKTFWMPSVIRSRSTADNGTYTWNFDGAYTSYHLFHADARILPADPN